MAELVLTITENGRLLAALKCYTAADRDRKLAVIGLCTAVSEEAKSLDDEMSDSAIKAAERMKGPLNG